MDVSTVAPAVAATPKKTARWKRLLIIAVAIAVIAAAANLLETDPTK